MGGLVVGRWALGIGRGGLVVRDWSLGVGRGGWSWRLGKTWPSETLSLLPRFREVWLKYLDHEGLGH